MASGVTMGFDAVGRMWDKSTWRVVSGIHKPFDHYESKLPALARTKKFYSTQRVIQLSWFQNVWVLNISMPNLQEGLPLPSIPCMTSSNTSKVASPSSPIPTFLLRVLRGRASFGVLISFPFLRDRSEQTSESLPMYLDASEPKASYAPRSTQCSCPEITI